ncbi:hypothetical protein EO087_14325 [Dyella sp. M7H15-1]|nr:hypothetical protein EO087_14325 [Dyella sp. M7H15-1]
MNRTGAGTYLINFSPAFNHLPAITGSQWGFGTSQNTKDNVTFPLLSANQSTVFTGDAGGNRSDRNFSFIAIGIVNVAP